MNDLCPACKHHGKPIGNMGLNACENIICGVVVYRFGLVAQPMNDGEFLTWIANRLVGVHNEHPGQDFILKLRSIAGKL